jgi:hypothetical protein
MFAVNSGSRTTRATSVCSLATTGFGVPAGANRPNHTRFCAPLAGLCQRRHVGQRRRAPLAVDRQRLERAGLDLPDDVAERKAHLRLPLSIAFTASAPPL